MVKKKKGVGVGPNDWLRLSFGHHEEQDSNFFLLVAAASVLVTRWTTMPSSSNQYHHPRAVWCSLEHHTTRRCEQMPIRVRALSQQ